MNLSLRHAPLMLVIMFISLITLPFIVGLMTFDQAQAAPKISISKCKINVDNVLYNGKAQKPDVEILYKKESLSKRNYNLKFYNNKDAGIAKVRIIGKNRFKGIITKKFKISQTSIKNDCYIDISEEDYYYDGKKKLPSVKLSLDNYNLKLNKDYTLNYSNNIEAGNATLKISAKGKNFKDSYSYKYEINKCKIKETDIQLNNVYFYTGKKLNLYQL